MLTRLALLAFVVAVFLALVETVQAQPSAPPASCDVNLEDTSQYAGLLEISQMNLQRRLALALAERDRALKQLKAVTDELAAMKKGATPAKPEDTK